MSGGVKIAVSLFALAAVLYVYRQVGNDQRNRAAAERSIEALTSGPATHYRGVGLRPATGSNTRQRP